MQDVPKVRMRIDSEPWQSGGEATTNRCQSLLIIYICFYIIMYKHNFNPGNASGLKFLTCLSPRP